MATKAAMDAKAALLERVGAGGVLGATLFMEAISPGESDLEESALQDATAIAQVILNRVRKGQSGSRRFKTTVAANCLDPAEFSCWGDARNLERCLAAADADEGSAAGRWFRQCEGVARAAQAGRLGSDMPPGVYWYYARSMSPSPWWVRKAQPWRPGRAAVAVYQTRGHFFFDDIDWAPASSLTKGERGRVKEAQQVLVALGFDPGPVDGLAGHLTLGALAEAWAAHRPGEAAPTAISIQVLAQLKGFQEELPRLSGGGQTGDSTPADAEPMHVPPAAATAEVDLPGTHTVSAEQSRVPDRGVEALPPDAVPDYPGGLSRWTSRTFVSAFVASVMGFVGAVAAGAKAVGIALPIDPAVLDPEALTNAIIGVSTVVTAIAGGIAAQGRRNGGRALSPLT